jgi:hypothetical protein
MRIREVLHPENHGIQWIGFCGKIYMKPWFLHVFTIKYMGFLRFPVNFPIIQFYDGMVKTTYQLSTGGFRNHPQYHPKKSPVNIPLNHQ